MLFTCHFTETITKNSIKCLKIYWLKQHKVFFLIFVGIPTCKYKQNENKIHVVPLFYKLQKNEKYLFLLQTIQHLKFIQ